MDNGQPSQRNNWTTGPEAKGQPFFTPGEGIQGPDSNPDLPNSLQGDAFNLDPRKLGENAINSRESDEGFSKENGIEIENSENQQIPQEEMNDLELRGPIQIDNSEIILNEASVIKTYKHLNEEGQKAVKNEVGRFMGGKINPSTFNDNIREMAKTNLINSFGENSEWKGEKAA